MSLIPSDWETATATLDAVRPRNTYESAAKARLSAELARAVRAYKVGTGIHARVSEPHYDSYVFLRSAITTTDLAAKLLDLFVPTFRGHFVDKDAHLKKPPAAGNPAGSDDNARANWLKAALNAHVAEPDLHFNDPSAAVIVAPDATSGATLIALAEELRMKAPAHRGSAESLSFLTVTSSGDLSAQYQQALATYNQRATAAANAVATAAPIARSGAVALGYAPGSTWGATDYQTLVARFDTLAQQAGYAENEYCSAVAAPAAAALLASPPPDSAPTPPAPGAAVVQVVGSISPTAETTLQTAIDNITEFAAGCAA